MTIMPALTCYCYPIRSALLWLIFSLSHRPERARSPSRTWSSQAAIDECDWPGINIHATLLRTQTGSELIDLTCGQGAKG